MNLLGAAEQGIEIATLAEAIYRETEVYPGITPQMDGEGLTFVLEFPGEYLDGADAPKAEPDAYISRKVTEAGYRVLAFLADTQEGHEYYTIERAD